MPIVRIFFFLSLKYISYFHNILWFYKHWCSNFFFNSFLTSFAILKAADILAVLMLKYIGSFYWLYKALNTMNINQQYIYILRFFFYSYFIYLYRCYSYIFCFHFKGWPKRRIIHIASSVVLQNAIKLSTNRGHITFPWIWWLTGITFARRKSITITRKIYLRLFFLHFRGLSVIFIVSD
jgi:hypothetical protein